MTIMTIKDAKEEFEQLNEALIKKQLLKDGYGKTTAAQKEFASLEKSRQLAKDRFDLVIQKQKLLQAQMAILQEKIIPA